MSEQQSNAAFWGFYRKHECFVHNVIGYAFGILAGYLIWGIHR